MKTIDTRDLLKRKNELEELRDAVTEAQEAVNEHRSTQGPTNDADEAEEWNDTLEDLTKDLDSAQADFGTEEQEELEELENLEDEISDFRHGETMIPESDFEDYARQYAEDIGAIPDDLPAYIRDNINWAGVADDLSADYTSVTYLGEDYYVRA